eukprot:39638-Eustigmatos_ZCMA.PRE.1
MKVKELFLVREEETQQVLQGQDVVVDSVHRVRLEVAFGKKVGRLTPRPPLPSHTHACAIVLRILCCAG